MFHDGACLYPTAIFEFCPSCEMKFQTWNRRGPSSDIARELPVVRADNPQAPRQPSWERVRPVGLHPVPTAFPLEPAIRRQPAFQPALSPRYDDYYHRSPAPEVPASPTATTSTNSTSHSSRHDSYFNNPHWVPIVFGQSRPSTNFVTTGSEYVK